MNTTLNPSLIERTQELNKLVRMAALSLDPRGSLVPLADEAGLKIPAIRAALRRGYFTLKQATALHSVAPTKLPVKKLCKQAKNNN